MRVTRSRLIHSYLCCASRQAWLPTCLCWWDLPWPFVQPQWWTCLVLTGHAGFWLRSTMRNVSLQGLSLRLVGRSRGLHHDDGPAAAAAQWRL
jgi:hypothetical protein